jgi:hypothetical protein
MLTKWQGALASRYGIRKLRISNRKVQKEMTVRGDLNPYRERGVRF